MDTAKVTEVEMKDIIPAQEDKDVEKEKIEGTQDAETGSEEGGKKETEIKEKEKEIKEENVYSKLGSPTDDIYNPLMPTTIPKSGEAEKVEEKEKEEEKEGDVTNVYCKLNKPSENVYMSAMTSSTSKDNKAEKVEEKDDDVYCKLKNPEEDVYMSAVSSSAGKDKKDVYSRVLLYKKICVGFIFLSLFLLAVVIGLVIKSSAEVRSIEKCPEECSRELCQTKYSLTPVVRNQGYQCSECERGWLKFGNSCYFMSKERFGWYMSRKECQKKGGDLIVIDNDHLQTFMSRNLSLMYWIGLRFTNDQWLWNNHTALKQSYWASDQPESVRSGSCGMLRGNPPQKNNWHIARCDILSYYICQKS